MDEPLSALDIMTAVAVELATLFPASAVTQEGDVVTLEEGGVRVALSLFPYPKVHPRCLRLAMRSNYGAYWQGAEWPFKWYQVARALDRLILKGRASQEFDALIAARKQAFTPLLHGLRTKLRKHGSVYMKVTATGDPLFFFLARTWDPTEAVQLKAAIEAHTKQLATVSCVVRAGHLSPQELETLNAALTPVAS